MPYILVIIALLVVVNFYLLFIRSKRNRNVGKKATVDRIKAVKHHDDLIRKLDHEQEEAAKYVELRNKTLDMYDQVRKQNEFDDHESDDPE